MNEHDCLTSEPNCIRGIEKCDPCAERDFQNALDYGDICQCRHHKVNHPVTRCIYCHCTTFVVYWGDDAEGVPA